MLQQLYFGGLDYYQSYSNSGEAIEAANERQRYLDKVYTKNGCGELQADAPAPANSTATEQNLSKKLLELNELHEQGILSEEEYSAAKRKLLEL